MRYPGPIFMLAMFALTIAGVLAAPPIFASAQETAAGSAPEAAAPSAPEPLTAEELEILVARIALYPDESCSLEFA
jgi:hypothetical protein